MLIRRLQNKKTNHNEIMNIALYTTTTRKARPQAKIQNYKHGRTKYIYKCEGGEFSGFTIQIVKTLTQPQLNST